MFKREICTEVERIDPHRASELVHGGVQVLMGAAPIDNDGPQCEPDEFRRDFIDREVVPSLDDLVQLRVDVLDGVVYNFANYR